MRAAAAILPLERSIACQLAVEDVQGEGPAASTERRRRDRIILNCLILNCLPAE
jgi:hypothetical protein